MILKPGSITERILEYERSRPEHRSGTVDLTVLQALEDLVPEPVNWSMETGCGKSTILLSNLSARHHVFTVDDGGGERSSIAYFRECADFRPERTLVITGPTQLTLPQFRFDQPIDLAFLDGPHGYPFPELEYYFVYPHLRPGSLLIIDDIHIPTIHHLYRVLRDDEMFRLVRVERTTAFFLRTEATVFSPHEDGWWLQLYNKARFPVDILANPDERDCEVAEKEAAVSRLKSEVESLLVRIQQLDGDKASLAANVVWWQHVAEERRLKRRLERRVEAVRSWLRG